MYLYLFLCLDVEIVYCQIFATFIINSRKEEEENVICFCFWLFHSLKKPFLIFLDTLTDLNHAAAKHKIAIKPNNRRTPSRLTGTSTSENNANIPG